MHWYPLFSSITIILSLSLQANPLSITVNADSAILINADTGVILFEKNSHKLHYPASTTKTATVAYALKQKGNILDVPVTAEQDSIASISQQTKKKNNYSQPAYWLEQGSSHMGIKKGEILTFKDLLYGAMVPSANDAANVIGQYVGGTIPEFMKGLNAHFQEIGAKDTHFENPHGLHHPKHQTTAYDLAIIAADAMRNPTFRQIVSTVHYTRPKTNKQESTTLVQSNRLLKKGQFYYSKAIGIKTGYTSNAQHTLVAAAKDGDRTLIAVLLKTPERADMFRDAIKLFEAAFIQPKIERVLLKSGEQKFTTELAGASNPLQTYLPNDISITYYPAEEPILKALLFWDTLTVPIKKNQKVGELRLVLEDNTVVRVEPIYALQDVHKAWFGGLLSLGNGKGKEILKIGGVLGVIFLLGGLWLRRGKNPSSVAK